MANISSLATVTTTATALSNLILASPQTTVGYQPQNAPNTDGTPSTAQPPPSFMFHYEGEQSVMIESDITDHYVEDNTALQDQIALKPAIITTHGFIGELNNVTPVGLQTVKSLADKLTIISAYTPALSTSALIAYNTAFQLYQVGVNAVNAAVSAWSSINGGGSGAAVVNGNNITNTGQSNQNKQQIAFQQLYGYYSTRTLFTVQTPWAVFQNMAIKSLRAIQDAETNVISDFEISFKQIRFASTTTSQLTVGADQQGRASAQSAGVTDLGTSAPPAGMSLLSGLSGNYGIA